MQKKLCPRCNQKKSIDEFNRRKRGDYYCWCRKCLSLYQRERWKSRKLKAVELLGGKCQKCGYCKNLSALDFHHLKDKKYGWHTLRKKSWDKIVEELKKCILLCKNCHCEEHNPDLTIENTDTHADNRMLNSYKSEPHVSPTGICEICKKEVYGTKFCSKECSSLSQRRVARPSKRHLKNLLKTSSFSQIGRDYDVSDNAVRKWAKFYDLLECKI